MAKKIYEWRTVPTQRFRTIATSFIQITASGICGSDLHLYDGMMPTMEKGDILGHEPMGIVVEIGKGIANLKKGDCVACAWRKPKGKPRPLCLATFDSVLDKIKVATSLGTDRVHVLREAAYCCRGGGTLSLPGVYIGMVDKFPNGSDYEQGPDDQNRANPHASLPQAAAQEN